MTPGFAVERIDDVALDGPDKREDQESGRIRYGRSGSDGLWFRMEDAPVIVPSPTVVQTDDGYVVFYTGVDADGSDHLLYATGADIPALEQSGIGLPNSKGEKNGMEATLLRNGDRWQLRQTQ